MEAKQLLELIKSRHSIRRYSQRQVDDDLLEQILEAGRWAPSGQNNQPWRFVVVRSESVRGELAGMTKYGKIIERAPVSICTFMHKPSMYNQIKDVQGIGACLENMLLMAHGLGLGAVWLGEILKNADQVSRAVGLNEDYELMAVVALGWPEGDPKQTARMDMDELVVGRLN